MRKQIIGKIIVIALMALILGFFNLPHETLSKLIPQGEDFFSKQKIHLGLDLQGGTQLDYKIDLRKVDSKDQKAITEGVKTIIEKRVNSLGVAEPNIYTSQIADEHHIIVELAGIKDLEEAKKAVGKVIQLEFKEEKTEIEPEKKEDIRNRAQEALDKILAGEDFKVIGEEDQQAFAGKVTYSEQDKYFFSDELVNEKLKEIIFEKEIGEVIPELIEITEQDAEYTYTEAGQLKPNTGFATYKLLDKIEEDREIKHEKEVKTSHILITYQGTPAAEEDLTRTEEEAKTRAQEVLEKAKSGEDFDSLAKEYSDDKSNKETGGKLEEPVKKDGGYVQEFTDGALALENVGDLSDLVKSEFGYHIIKADEITPESSETKLDTKVKYARIFYSTLPDPWKETGLTGKNFKHADVQFNQAYQPYVSIEFDDEGGKLFEEITERNVNKPVAIFVGGQLISAPNVNEKISGGRAQISGNFDLDEATQLARDLNTGAIPAPITLAGQYTIGATLGQDALNKSLKAGAIGLILLAIYMLLYYKLPGLLANAALFIYAIILLFLIKVSLPLYAALGIATVLFIILLSRILKSDDSGWEKLISFVLACFVLFFLTFLLSTSLVLTLAGIAGIILSIGMAVDANVLIFERIKEELRAKRPLSSAIDVGFERAWTSIRDSNFSSLITCAILLYFGTSIIKGFAFNLATGILVSMFTAITITKTFLRAFVGTKTGEKLHLFGYSEKEKRKPLQIVKNSKRWFSLSGALIAISLISIIIFGIKPGLDFTGGTLIEVKFNQEVSIKDVNNVISQVEKGEIDNSPAIIEEKSEEATDETLEEPAAAADETLEEPAAGETEEPTIEITEEAEVIVNQADLDFGKPVIIPSGENSFIIRMKHIDSDTHDLLINQFKKSFGELEEPRYTTVGPVIGKTLAKKAVFALGLAIIMIILYIAFAFRRVPKHVNPWRFGLCAVAALVHDIMLTVGLFSILGVLMNVEIDALFITALLTIMGFSVHDTIVVFDRIRENLKYQKRGEDFDDVTNAALNQTMVRSINTSISTLFTITALFILGAASIKFFTLALVWGTIVGTYSSIFTASPVLAAWRRWKRKKMGY